MILCMCRSNPWWLQSGAATSERPQPVFDDICRADSCEVCVRRSECCWRACTLRQLAATASTCLWRLSVVRGWTTSRRGDVLCHHHSHAQGWWHHRNSTTRELSFISLYLTPHCWRVLWPPYRIEQAIIFCPVVSFFLLVLSSICFFSPNLSSHRLDVPHASLLKIVSFCSAVECCPEWQFVFDSGSLFVVFDCRLCW